MLHQTTAYNDTSTEPKSGIKADPALPLSMGVCEDCPKNIDLNRCGPVRTSLDRTKRLVRCAGAGATKSNVDVGMVPAQTDLQDHKKCKRF